MSKVSHIISHPPNKTYTTLTCFVCWVADKIPVYILSEVQRALEAACREAGVAQLGATLQKSEPPHGAPMPPTHYAVNKYTTAFQAIVEVTPLLLFSRVARALLGAVNLSAVLPAAL
jgi:hypothetical protein